MGLANSIEKSPIRDYAADNVEALGLAVRFVLRHTSVRHRQAKVAECVGRPRYVVAENWGHYFSDDVPEFDVRWVFDRHRWHLAELHVKRRSSSTWLKALPDEVGDLDESLMDANADALDVDMEEFGTVEAHELPQWIDEAIETKRQTFVGAFAFGDGGA